MADKLSKVDAALAWAARGFRVFPLRPGSKKPLPGFENWQDRATAVPEEVRKLWTDPITDWPQNYNIGVLTDGLVVVDVDEKNGKRGLESFFNPALDLHLDTLVVKTPSGGLHVYFTGPHKANSSQKLGPGLDTRSFHGYVLAPGSYLDPADPDNKGVGGFYLAEIDAPIAPAPAAVLARLDAPRERTAEAVVELDLPLSVECAVEWLAAAAPAAIEGAGGDHTTFTVACRLRDYGISEALAVELMAEHYNERCCPPWSPEELAVKVANAYAYGQNAPGAASPAALVSGLDGLVSAPPPPRTAAGAWFHHGDDWSRDAAWLFYEALPATGTALLTAPSQAGKSFLAVHLAHMLATGRRFFNIAPDEVGGTIFLAAEGNLVRRLAALEEDARLPIAGCHVSGLSVQGALDAVEAALRAKADEMLAEFGVPVRLIVLDTLSASGLLADENDNAEAAAAMNRLAQISERLGALVLVTHHPKKGGGGERGAGAIRNSADYVLEITREGNRQLRDLKLTKARDAQQRDLGTFSLDRVVLGRDGKGREVSSCVVTTSSVERPAKEREPSFAGALREAVDWAIGDQGGIVEGREAVEIDVARKYFRERYTGSDAHFKRAWDRSLDWSTKAGLLDVLQWCGKKYLAPLKIELGEAA